MKKIYVLLLLVAGFANAQIVDIPDANFKAKLLSITPGIIDVNSDGEIQFTEAQAVGFLNVSSSNIADLTGIEQFTSLISLNCSNNQLTSLDLGELMVMTSLECKSNQIASLILPASSAFTNLNCNDNKLTTLSITNNPSISSVSCMRNLLTSLLIVSPALTSLNCAQNQLTAIDFSGMTDLEFLDCSRNQLTSIDVSGLVTMAQFNCSYNQLNALDLTGLGPSSLFIGYNNIQTFVLPDVNYSDLDISGNLYTHIDFTTDYIARLDCAGTQLISIDLSNVQTNYEVTIRDNTNLEFLNLKNGQTTDFCPGIVPCLFISSITGNTALNSICVDDAERANFLQYFVDLNLEPINLTGYCAFTPGGDYNHITGNLGYDLDNNGCDIGDLPPMYVRMNMTDGVINAATTINSLGTYHFYTGAGNFTVTPAVENAGYFNFSPVSASVNFPVVNNSVVQRDFCFTANGNHPDLEIVLVPLAPLRPGFESSYQIVYRNKGNQTLSGAVNFALDDTRLNFVTANPSVSNQTLNTLLWNFGNLRPLETRAITFTLLVNSPTANPAVNLGDVLEFVSNITIVAGEETPTDNVSAVTQVALNSYDPNDKTCLEGTNVLPEHIGKYLHYNINFENTGAADAVNVVVKDTINITKYDINSLQLLYASHPVYTKITGNIVEFIFENINLPPSIMNPIGGHGNVLFKIKTLPNLTVGDEVSNTANIYFDYNAPIDTNEARTAFYNLSKSDFVKDNSVTVYPNPTKDKVTVSARGRIESIQVYDVQGRVLETVIVNKKETTLDLSAQSDGVYL